MKKSQLKRTIALLLSIALLMAGSTEAFAGNVYTKTDGFLSAEMGAGVITSTEQPIGTPLTDVTEDEALAFERGLETELSGVTGADTTLSQNAKKKAAAMVSLYGETSVQYAVMQNGELLLSDAYGTDDASKKTKVTTDSVYGIASISKMFTTGSTSIFAPTPCGAEPFLATMVASTLLPCSLSVSEIARMISLE